MLAKADRCEHQDHISKSVFNNLLGLLGMLRLPLSARYNASYCLDDAAHVLLRMCKYGQSASAACDDLSSKHGKNAGANPKAPTPQWLLSLPGRIPEREMASRCRRMLRRTVRDMRASGMLPKNIVLAVDTTLIPWYGDPEREDVVRSKPKSGTASFRAYATSLAAVRGHLASLGAASVAGGDGMGALVRKLVRDAREQGFGIRYALLDRGFYSVDAMGALGRAGVRFIMPAVKNSTVKDAIGEYIAGRRERISRFTITAQDGTSATFWLYITRKNGWRKSDRPVDRYVAFATTLPRHKVAKRLQSVPRAYRERWMIECDYKCIKSVMPRTTSRNSSVRHLMFCLPMIITNLWELANHAAEKSGLSRPLANFFRLSLFMNLLLMCAFEAIFDPDLHADHHMESVS